MPAAALTEAVLRLPWLAPSAGSLVHWARAGNSVDWAALRLDPGCVALLLRAAPQALTPVSFASAALLEPAPLTFALAHLDAPGFLDLGQPPNRTVYEAAVSYADRAARLAALSSRIHPEAARAAALLAPLGWFAVCATATEAVELDRSALGLRLARRWELPAWVTAVVGHLGLPVDAARRLGADPDLFLLVQLAIGLEERHQPRLGLELGARPTECAAALGFPMSVLTQSPPQAPSASVWQAPQNVPLLREVLQLGAENRRLARSAAVDRLEQEYDEMHAALRQLYTAGPERLQSQRLSMMAEFAAGAGHEINNPLAVISGQAQYLLGQEEDPAREKALRKIVGQTRRVHDILVELMQFARPARPQKRAVDLGGLVRETVADLADLAEQRKVRVDGPEPEPVVELQVDGRQIRMALTCLLRNAIEAAPVEGWAAVRLQSGPDRVELLVEDSGPGPTPAQREHMFDPFYSGRQAGRGRGLGLPTAWRLAREHGGDVLCDDRENGPTRFILRLPRDAAAPGLPNGSGPALIAS